MNPIPGTLTPQDRIGRFGTLRNGKASFRKRTQFPARLPPQDRIGRIGTLRNVKLTSRGGSGEVREEIEVCP